MNKNVSIAIGNTQDVVVELLDVPYNDTVQNVVDNSEGQYWLETNPNGQTDLCTEIDEAADDVEGSFTEYGTANPYSLFSNDFVGGRPQTRCPKCVI